MQLTQFLPLPIVQVRLSEQFKQSPEFDRLPRSDRVPLAQERAEPIDFIDAWEYGNDRCGTSPLLQPFHYPYLSPEGCCIDREKVVYIFSPDRLSYLLFRTCHAVVPP